MSDDKVIDITELIKKRKEKEMQDTKRDLVIAIDDLDIDIEKILNTFVNFNVTNYTLDKQDSFDPINIVIYDLEMSATALKSIGLDEAAKDIENAILKIKDYVHGDKNEN